MRVMSPRLMQLQDDAPILSHDLGYGGREAHDSYGETYSTRGLIGSL